MNAGVIAYANQAAAVRARADEAWEVRRALVATTVPTAYLLEQIDNKGALVDHIGIVGTHRDAVRRATTEAFARSVPVDLIAVTPMEA
jgi:hypothetical protein